MTFCESIKFDSPVQIPLQYSRNAISMRQKRLEALQPFDFRRPTLFHKPNRSWFPSVFIAWGPFVNSKPLGEPIRQGHGKKYIASRVLRKVREY